MSSPAAPLLDALATPLCWLDAEGTIAGCNTAFARWLGVSARRVRGARFDALDGEGERVRDLLARLGDGVDEPLRARRARLRLPGSEERFADLWLTRSNEGVLVEVHPADEFPGEDPATTLPSALHAALKAWHTRSRIRSPDSRVRPSCWRDAATAMPMRSVTSR
jgi:two-component system nitrogen regulation sensor histidine kinase GlnL